jgi:uncharacterized protein (DUF2252 family)
MLTLQATAAPASGAAPAVEARGWRARGERIEAGKRLRETHPREDHALWRPPESGRDPLAILQASNRGRVPELVPIRYGRMLASPFTFLRGSAALMACDLATTPTTGIHVQACGDCHLLNFGLFATPERNLVFDVNDFDETLPAPWEWDLKRLAASFAVAARDQGLSDEDGRAAAEQCGCAYRTRLREYSRISPLEVWYARLDMQELIDLAPDEKARKRRESLSQRARERILENVFPKIVSQVGGRSRFVDQPPLIYHSDSQEESLERWQAGLNEYRATLPEERRVLLDRYRLEDCATKVVGIGSVGTRCGVALLFSEDNHPLILQVKEATRSVLEPYAGPCRHDNQGERVVVGQRLMQSSSDIFLGWARGKFGHDFYVRQLRDMKFSVPVEGVTAVQLGRYAEICGWTLARAHAKSGDAATISGYLGKGDQFETALAAFALRYADQTEQDYEVLLEAHRSGRIEAITEDEV